MKLATEDPIEYKQCLHDFEKRERKYYMSNLRKRRKRCLLSGEGRYFNAEVNERWMTWQACWDWIKSPVPDVFSISPDQLN